MDVKTVVIIILAFIMLVFLVRDEEFFEKTKKRIKSKLHKKKDVEVPIDCCVNIDNIKKRIDGRVELITDLIQTYSEESRTSLGDSSYTIKLLYDESYNFYTNKECIIRWLDELEEYLYLYREYYKESKKL